ncbi:aldehyde dehydrogenase family protein [Chitinophagaceae bacterium IBVUCB2]|nr:aldehyde dehydrogenase family protein [Chitinophagaceae bacterium IBVUCB2]
MPDISSLEKMRQYFNSGATRSYGFRKEQLKKLKQAIIDHEQDLYDALYADLKKSPEEVWATETGMTLAELSVAIKKLRDWMEPESVTTNLLNLPSSSKVMREPLGVVLIIGPWNYPFQLLINPLIGAIAAGNCVVLKPSEFAPATEAVMKKIIESTFSSDYILYAQGDGATVIPAMMNIFSFDHVFYTGSTAVGKIIYKMAAERLVPVTLELGGKSPCVVEEDANIKVAAKRIAMTTFSNAGQMCVAPDYILAHASVKDKLIEALKESIIKFFSNHPEDSYSYGKIINAKQFDRITGYLSQGKIVHGGRTNKEKLFIEPTILTDVGMNGSIMKEEIFGPVLPVISFTTMEDAKSIIQQNPNPLSFYIYTSSNKKAEEWLQAIPAGGTCVNNSSWHLTNHHLPFGGRGYSGTGNYHGKYSFDTFSHKKAVMKTPTWFDPSIKYPPFKGKLKLFKWVIK